MTHNDIYIIYVSHFFVWNYESCMRGYSKHFSCGNILPPTKNVFAPVVKTEKKKKKKKNRKKTDTDLGSRALQAVMGLLFVKSTPDLQIMITANTSWTSSTFD